MAKTLPPLGDVPDGWYTRLAAILPGGNAAQKQAAFVQATRDWWRRQVIDAERRAAIDDAEQAKQAAFDAIDNAPDINDD